MVWMETTEQRTVLGKRIYKLRRSKGWTQAKLGELSGYDEKTIRNVEAGRSTHPQTLTEICEALGIEFGDNDAESKEVAGEGYGAYAKTNFGHYAGHYFGYRRKFARDRKILRSCFSISWSQGHLMFSERQSFDPIKKPDPSDDHDGHIYISAHTGLIHLMNVHQGAMRLITLTKSQGHTMRGVVLTQSSRPLFYQPSVSALLLEKMSDPIDERSFYDRAGMLAADDPEYQRINAALREIEADVIFVAQSQDA